MPARKGQVRRPAPRKDTKVPRPKTLQTTVTVEEMNRALQLAGNQSIAAWLYDQIAHLLAPVPGETASDDVPLPFDEMEK